MDENNPVQKPYTNWSYLFLAIALIFLISVVTAGGYYLGRSAALKKLNKSMVTPAISQAPTLTPLLGVSCQTDVDCIGGAKCGENGLCVFWERATPTSAYKFCKTNEDCKTSNCNPNNSGDDCLKYACVNGACVQNTTELQPTQTINQQSYSVRQDSKQPCFSDSECVMESFCRKCWIRHVNDPIPGYYCQEDDGKPYVDYCQQLDVVAKCKSGYCRAQ